MNTKQLFTDDNKLRRMFSWLTRIGAAPKFGSRPIGWYQAHQIKAIEWLESNCHGCELRCRGGMIQHNVLGVWTNAISASQLFTIADKNCR